MCLVIDAAISGKRRASLAKDVGANDGGATYNQIIADGNRASRNVAPVHGELVTTYDSSTE